MQTTQQRIELYNRQTGILSQDLANKLVSNETKQERLIPALAKFLKSHYRYAEPASAALHLETDDKGRYADSTAADYLLHAVINALDEIAPDGTLFFENSAGYGFWSVQ